MNWLEVAAIVVLLLGIGAGGFLVAQRPAFWLGLGTDMLRAALPFIMAYLFARMPPEQEKEMRECLKRGGTWDNFRKRCRDK